MTSPGAVRGGERLPYTLAIHRGGPKTEKTPTRT